jgi:isoleucyl-tRNA synthetase
LYKPVPPKVDFPSMEHEILRFWEERRIFRQLVDRNRGNDRFSFIDGPITANNPMGVHHAWGRTYKDIYQRFKAMQGFDQRYQNGFDCQGLWVEVEVEKDLGLNSKRQIEEYGLDNFAERCRERVLTYADVITQQSIRLGQWMDWDSSYYTMSDNNIEHIWHFLKKCHEAGWLYKGWNTMPWCTRCGTSLSQHELVGTDSYREVTHPSVYLKLPILNREGEYFLVWTTTPWTLPANVALAVHPDLDYAAIRDGDETYYLSAKLAPVLTPQFSPNAARQRGSESAERTVLRTVKGSELVGLRYRGPFDELEAQANIEHRVVPWEDVGEEEGTGIVHIAPGCGAEDFGLSKVHDLQVVVPIDENGDYYPGFGSLTGINSRDVAEPVFASLREKEMLFRREEITHRYPTCWRCGQEIVFRTVYEWFISSKEIRPRMIAAARTVTWTPPAAGKRMEDWLTNMGDWCISRKRYWGLPLPFYPCSKCGTLTVVGSVDELRELAVSGIDEVRELHRPWIDAVHIGCPDCGVQIKRVTEVGDCWLDAGIVPFSTLGSGYLKDPDEWAKWYPADWVSEMREQIRLWFYSMLFMSVALKDRSPYQAVLTYEKLLDEHGNPMHKSLGNAIWFDEAAERMGADVMRWLYAGQNLQSNLLFGYGPAEEARRKLLTLWNVYSFYVTYAEIEEWRPDGSGVGGQGSAGTTKTSSPIPNPRPPTPAAKRLDAWVLARLNELVALANERLTGYDVAALVDGVDRFVDDLSNWWVRRSRRRFARAADPADREAALSTLHACLVTLARVMAPVMPFLSEEMYQNVVRSWDGSAPESVHLTRYPEADVARTDAAALREMELAREIVTLGRSARNDAAIRVRQPLAAITVAGELGDVRLSDELIEEIADELNVKRVEIAQNVEEFARRVAHPVPKLLGPRLGARFPEINRALHAGEYTIQEDGSVRIDGELLAREEVSITLEPLADRAVVQALQWQGGLAVALDRAITPELRAEGLAREIVHHVQMMRRDAGLSVEDHIALHYATDSPELKAVFEAHGAHISDEVGATEVVPSSKSQVPSPGREDDAASSMWNGEIEGERLALSLRRVAG